MGWKRETSEKGREWRNGKKGSKEEEDVIMGDIFRNYKGRKRDRGRKGGRGRGSGG